MQVLLSISITIASTFYVHVQLYKLWCSNVLMQSYCARHGHKSKSPGRSPEKDKPSKEEKETLRQKKYVT